jgi:MYXO-CTERM domain-containing protein
MSNLANFSANVDEFGVGIGSSDIGGRARGIVTLAQNSTIIANIIRLSSGQSSAQGPGSVFLGQNTKINATSLLVAERRGLGGMAFAPGITNGSLTIRGKDGVSPANIFQLGTMVGGDTSNGTGTAIFVGTGTTGSGVIDVWANTFLMGRGGGGTTNGFGRATLNYDNGIIRAGEMIIGDNGGQTVAGAQIGGQGTFIASGTALLQVDGNLTLGRMGSADQRASAGTLTLSNGATATVAGDVVDGLGGSTVSVNGATLSARRIGSNSSPIDSLTLNNATVTLAVGGGVAAGNANALTADGTNLIKLKVAGAVSVGQQKLMDYSSIAGAGFSSFTLDPKLPARMVATLAETPGDSIVLNVTSFDNPRWNGNLGTTWDINTTQNWVLNNAGGPTTYQEDLATYSTTDTVLFNDLATGTTTVNVSTTVAPAAITVDNSTKSYTFTGSGAIVGSPSLTKTGSNVLTLANTGASTLGVVTVSGGTLQIGDGVTAGGGNVTASQIVNNANVVLNRAGDFTFSTPISGNGLVEKIGTGVATFSGNSTHTGTTNINGGKVVVTNFGALGAVGEGTVNIASGAQLDIGGIAPDNVGGGFGDKEFFIAGAGPDGSGAIVNTGNRQQNAFQRITLTGNATVGGTPNVGAGISTLTPGRWDIRAAQVSGANFARLTLNGNTLTKTGDTQFTLVATDVTNGNIVVNQGTFAVETTSNLDSNGLINLAGDNTRWQFFNTSGTSSLVRPAVVNGAGVQIGNNSSTPSFVGSPVTLNNDVTVTNFNNATGGLTLVGDISQTGGARKLTKSGGNSLALLGNNSFTGGVQVDGGTLTANRLSNGTLTVNGGNVQVLAKGTPNDPSGTSVVPALSIAATGAQLDLTNNSMVIDYTGPVGTLVGDVRQHIQSARLVSTSATSTTGLGYADNAVLAPVKTTFGGQSVDPSSLLIKFTYFGDSNLDGQVDVADLGNLATNWQTANVWSGGDFDYNGTVDVNDLGLLATNWQAGVGSPLGPDFATAAAQLGLPNVSVPEPAGIALGSLVLAGLARRRRRAE